jgi:hypothetical protein
MLTIYSGNRGPKLEMNVTFEQLWAIADQCATEMGEPPDEMFDSIGLYLVKQMEPWEYYCTPKNVQTFTYTRCDGVHYSVKTDHYAGDLTKLQIALLAGLGYKLSLKPWLHLEERIAELQEKYADLWVIPGEDEYLEAHSQQEVNGLELSAYRITDCSTGLSELVEVLVPRSNYHSKLEKGTENRD